MDYQLTVDGYPLNHIALNLGWSSNKDTLGQELTFEMPFDETGGYFPKDFINPGSKVILKYKSELIFFGTVIDEEANGRSPRNFKCLDLAFYLNKSKITIQFNNKPADKAIEELLKRFNVKCTITNIPVQIKKIYKAEVVSDILKDILSIAESQTGNKYRFEMRGDTLVVFNWRDIYLKTNVQWVGNPIRKRSIENMRNSIEIIADSEKSSKIIASAKDSSNIKKYGLLQESQTIDEKELSKAKNVANKLLKELNRIQESGSVSLLGNYNARAGRLITLNEPITGLSGDYFIISAQHTISNGIHLMDLGLEVV